MALEKTIQANVLKYLNSLPECEAENVHGNAYQKNRPDVNACFRGRLLRIELKTPDHGNTPTEGQKENLRKWSLSGAICFVAYSLEEVKYVVDPQHGLACDNEFSCADCPVKKQYCYTHQNRRNK
jgi:hypothetical protein